ncbi:hypothetical protein F3Y22_tig00110156pilonHSYRG00083 [Hibiscus syriacus]|uniref:Aminotransferase class I/classII large domain-containing protein n=1 Tax=Hibiscus syriacus TaxID=106335 RepID=A0A6A3BLP8_HIBSY|nr:8-amino-7-oxononanoate synthase-like [Hibiscus syriacus]KAE8715972.1 hypothetical protein F3Y22_tig00110156pilonHSYRG00083 [Hibiscus syriacus]
MDSTGKMKSSWNMYIEEALPKLESRNMFTPLRPMNIPIAGEGAGEGEGAQTKFDEDEYQTYDEIQPWDRLAAQIELPHSFFQRLLNGVELVSKYELQENERICSNQETEYKKLILFAGNDFLGLSRHPTIAKATAKAAVEQGTGPRGSPLICGYTNYHMALESSLAKLKKKEACLLCTSGFGANMAVMVAIGSIVPVLCEGRRPTKEEKVSVFSDALNHASIVDGLKLADRLGGVELFMYKHCDMSHLDALLTNCKNTRKVVVTDSLFSMDGDIAPMAELAQLRKKHGFLWVLDDAHGTFVWGKNGGGLAEEFNCEYDVDISIGTLSKAASSLGGFVTCSKIWKQWIQSRGRSFIFSTIAPVPLAAASYASVVVAKKETWRRREIQNRMKELQALTGIPVKSQIVCVIIGDMMQAIKTNHELLKSGFYCVAVGPPAVAPNTARLRLTLTAVHTSEDIKRLAAIISKYVKFQVPRSSNCSDYITPRL